MRRPVPSGSECAMRKALQGVLRDLKGCVERCVACDGDGVWAALLVIKQFTIQPMHNIQYVFTVKIIKYLKVH